MEVRLLSVGARGFFSPLRDSASPLNSVAPNEKKTSGTQGIHILAFFIFSRAVFRVSPQRTERLEEANSTRAVIGQFSGPYSTVRHANAKIVFVAKLFRDRSSSVLTCNFFSKSLKL